MSENKTWKQERPAWCPHPDCLFVRRAMDAICVGHLPKPEPHDGDENIHRWCLNGAADNGGVFDLQINNTDLWWFRQMFSALDGKAVEHTLAADEPKADPMAEYRCVHGFLFCSDCF